MSIKQQIIDIRKRVVEVPVLKKFRIDQNNPLKQVVNSLVDGRPAWEAEYGLYSDNYRVLLGDTSVANKAFIGIGIDDNHWINFKPLVVNEPVTLVENYGEVVRWNNVGNEIDIKTLPYCDGVKTFLELGANANYNNLIFTVKLPANASLEPINDGQDAGEIKIVYDGIEKGYLPKPYGFDALGNYIEVNFVILPDLELGGVFFPAIQVLPVITQEHTAPYFIDPSFSYNYTDCTALSMHDATVWDFDRTGAGKSWGPGDENLGDFPKTPILIARKSAKVLEIHDADRPLADNPYITFDIGVSDKLAASIVSNTGIRQIRMNDGVLVYSADEAPDYVIDNYYADTVISFKEDLGANKRAGARFRVTTGGLAFDGKIKDRNIARGFIPDANFNYYRNLHHAANDVTRSARVTLAKDSANNLHVIGGNGPNISSKLSVIQLDLSQSGADDSPTPGNQAVQAFKVASDNTTALYANKAYSYNYFYKESQWTTNGSFTRQFYMLDWTLDGGNHTSSVGNKFLAVHNLGGDSGGALFVFDGDMMNRGYSGSVTLADLRANNDHYSLAIKSTYRTDIDFKIVDDAIGNGNWSCINSIEGESLVLVCFDGGVFCLDFSDAENPLFNGMLTDSTASGIFEGFNRLNGSPVIEACGVFANGKRTLAFYTAEKLFVYVSNLNQPNRSFLKSQLITESTFGALASSAGIF